MQKLFIYLNKYIPVFPNIQTLLMKIVHFSFITEIHIIILKEEEYNWTNAVTLINIS